MPRPEASGRVLGNEWYCLLGRTVLCLSNGLISLVERKGLQKSSSGRLWDVSLLP